jgi:tetratricopeptide (TPR) repeat protein
MKLPTSPSLISRFLSRPADPSTVPSPTDQSKRSENPSYKQDTSELWLMFGIGLLSLVVYALTLSPGVVPGSAAVATGKALGLLPSLPATNPLWLLASRAVAAVPVFDTVLRLNLFSAVCGSLAAAWLFRIVKRVLFEFIRDAPSIRLVPGGEEEHSDGLISEPESDGMEHIYASCGGVFAALVFAFSTPFWIASTALHAQPFNIFFVLFTLDLLLCYHYTGKTSVCVAAMVLFGLGLVESVIFVTLAPLALVLLIFASIRYGQISESFILLMFASALAGLAANLVLFTLLSAWGQTLSASLLFRLTSDLVHTHVAALTQGLPKTGWLFVFFQTTVPLLIALVSVRGFSSLQDEPTRCKWGVTNIIFTVYSIACLLNLPKTAWSLAREGIQLPIIPCLSIAIALGALFVYWCLVASSGAHTASYENDTPSFNLSLLGYGICGLLVIVSLRTLPLNLSDADGRKAAFADLIAEDMLKQAGSARCLMTDGTLDLNLIIRSHVTGRKLTFLPYSSALKSEDAPTREAKSTFRLTLPGTERSPKPTLTTFVEEWLLTNPKEHDQVAIVGAPRIWQRTGLTPVPYGLVYGGTDDTRSLDGKALLEFNRTLWRKVAPLLAKDATLRPELSRIHTQVRAYASRMANDLGVLLEALGDLPGAESAYSDALQLDENNLCSSLNRDGLHLRSKIPGASHEFIKHAVELASQPGFFEAFDVAVARYGSLSIQEADALLPSILKENSLGAKPPANMIRLVEKWLGASRTIPQTKSATLAKAACAATALMPDAMLSQAIALWLDGKSAKAEKLLRLIVGNRPNNLSAWALLAEVLMTRDQLKDVNDVVLPAMRAICAKSENADRTLVEMAQGCLLMRTVPPNPAAARVCFERAVTINPNLTAASDQLLRVDRLLGNASQLETDALKIVASNPVHPAANAILGSLMLGQKRTVEAEGFLRQSITTQPTAGTLNDLAELLRQQNKLTEAEHQARLAIRLAPDFYQAWDTLGNILIETGRLEEAHGALQCALTLSDNDPRLYLTLTLLRMKEGLPDEARRILTITAPMIDHASTYVRNEYHRYTRELDSRPATP